VQHQVAEIAGVERLQPRLVGGVHLLALAVGVGLVLGGIEVLGVKPAVLPAVDQPGELARGPAFLVQIVVGDQLLQEPQLVVRVDDRVVALQPDQLGVSAEHPGANRMERAEPWHPFDRIADQLAHPVAHLARRLVGEGDAEDLARPGEARADQVGETRRQRRGLAGSRARKHQHRAFGGQHRLFLWRVQAVEPRGRFRGLGRREGLS
jgi:hypothetical protein